MCLNKIEARFSSNGIGLGYKVLPTSAFKGNELTEFKAKNSNWSQNWKKSVPYGNKKLIDGCDGKQYYPGFHIFTDLESALFYESRWSFLSDKSRWEYVPSSSYVLVSVMYSQIRAYGTNATHNKLRRISSPCIVANKMRVHQVIGNAYEYWKKNYDSL